MIIPIRCMTCGKILADKWFKYLELVKEKSGITKSDNLLDINLKVQIFQLYLHVHLQIMR